MNEKDINTTYFVITMQRTYIIYKSCLELSLRKLPVGKYGLDLPLALSSATGNKEI